MCCGDGEVLLECSILVFWSVGVAVMVLVATEDLFGGVLFGFGGGDAPTTFLVAYGGDGVQLWRWLGVWWLCLGWWCLTELVTWWGFGRVSFSGLELLRW
jgi:hypothetical protein